MSPRTYNDAMERVGGTRGGWGKRQPEWMLAVRVGDVLTRNGRTFRVVRSISRTVDGRLRAVTFTIKRASWTGRPDTVLFAQDLMQLGYRHAGARVRLASALDQQFADYLRAYPSRKDGPYPLTPADVRGVA